MDFSAFSHGQIHSKLWLCETLEPYIDEPVNVIIVGSWYNVLGLLMMVRNRHLYKKIEGVDINSDHINTSNKICDAFVIIDNIVLNNHCSVDDVDFSAYDIVISTSTEDIQSSDWYEKIPDNKIVCLQSVNLDPGIAKKYNNWEIVNPNISMETFLKKFPMNQILFQGSKEFDYGDLKYDRYMIIGKK